MHFTVDLRSVFVHWWNKKKKRLEKLWLKEICQGFKTELVHNKFTKLYIKCTKQRQQKRIKD